VDIPSIGSFDASRDGLSLNWQLEFRMQIKNWPDWTTRIYSGVAVKKKCLDYLSFFLLSAIVIFFVLLMYFPLAPDTVTPACATFSF